MMKEPGQESSGPQRESESHVVPVRRVGRPASDLLEGSDYDGVSPDYPGGGLVSSTPSLVRSLLRRKWLIIGVFVLVSAVTVPLIWIMVIPTYRATAVVRITPVLNPILFKSEKTGAIPFYTSYVNTQVSIIRSPTVLERVLDRPEVRETSWYKGLGASLLGDSSTPLEALQRTLAALPRRGTELIDISVNDRNPNDAKEVVNVVVAEYKKLNDEIHKASDVTLFETLTRERDQLQMTINGLIETKFNISSQLGTVAPEELRSQLSMQLSHLEGQRDKLTRELKMVQWQLGQVPAAATMPAGDGEPGSVEQLYAHDQEWRALDRNLEEIDHQLELARRKFGEEHPTIEDLLSRRDYCRRLRDKREAQLGDDWESVLGQLTTMPEGTTPRAALEHLVAKKRQEIELLEQEIEHQGAKVAQAGEIAQEIARYEEEIGQKRELREAIRKRLEVLEMEGKAPARVRVAAYAMKPSKPDRDRRIVLTAMAMMGAMVVGLAVGYVRSSLDKRIYEASEVQRIYEVPFLGLLPRIPAKSLPRELGGRYSISPGKKGYELATYSSHSLMENMRMIRTALLERLNQTGEQVVLVTSSLPRTGKTSVAVLLAKSLAVVGKRVLLIEGDLRRPALAERLDIELHAGLAALLEGSADETEAIASGGIANLDILMAGKVPDDFDPELLANGVFATCLERWRSSYDFILVDSPPLLPVADAQILAGHVDGTIMVLKSSHDRKKEAAEAYSQLSAAGGRLLGTVLIGGHHGHSGGHYYDYGYYYGYYYSYAYKRRDKKPDSNVSST